MAERMTPIDIGDIPELLQLAEEVHRSHESRILRHDGEDLAMIVPLPWKQPSRRPRTTRRFALLPGAGRMSIQTS